MTFGTTLVLIAFRLQQWLHECASLLRYMYIACLVILSFVQSTDSLLLDAWKIVGSFFAK